MKKINSLKCTVPLMVQENSKQNVKLLKKKFKSKIRPAIFIALVIKDKLKYKLEELEQKCITKETSKGSQCVNELVVVK